MGSRGEGYIPNHSDQAWCCVVSRCSGKRDHAGLLAQQPSEWRLCKARAVRRGEQNLAGQFARIDKSAPRTLVYTIETLRDGWHSICCVTRDNGCRKIGQSFTIENDTSSRAPYFKLKNRAPGIDAITVYLTVSPSLPSLQ